MPFTICKIISALVLEIFNLEKCVKYANEMTDDIILNPILYQVRKWSCLGQFAAQTIETW